MNSRKVDELGRIVLPIEIRKSLGINVGDELLIEHKEKIIVLSKLNTNCIFCGRETELIKMMDNHICEDCISQLKFKSDSY